MRYGFPYVGADFRKLAHQPDIQRTMRDHGLANVSRDMPVYSRSFHRVLIPA